MPALPTEHPGSGMHTHEPTHANATGRAEFQLSSRLDSSSQGCCTTPRRDHWAVTNQWINSYKRLVGGVRPPVISAGATTTVLLWCGFRCKFTKVSRLRGGSSCLAGQRGPTRTWRTHWILAGGLEVRLPRKGPSFQRRPRMTPGRLATKSAARWGLQPLPGSPEQATAGHGGFRARRGDAR